MHVDIRQAESESTWLRRGSWVVLAVGLAGSALLWQHAASSEQAQVKAEFEQEGMEIAQHLSQTLDHYRDLLGSFQAMFKVNHELDRRTFHAHFESLHVPVDYPGLIAVHYAQRITDRQRPAFEASVRADRSLAPEGYPRFRIVPPGPRDAYVAVKYNEALPGHESMLGYDTAFDPVRRQALERARDLGAMQATEPVPLVQAQLADKLGILMRLPVYRAGAPTETVQARRQAYVGQISGVLHASVLMRPLHANDAQVPSLNWRVEDLGLVGATPKRPPKLLFETQAADASRGAGSQFTQSIAFGGRQWRLTFLQPAVNHAWQPYPLAVLVGGLLGSLGLWWALRSAANRHRQAARMARRLSDQAVQSEQRLRSVMDHTVDGIITIASTGWIIGVNEAVCRIFGHSEQALLRMHLSQLMPAAISYTQADTLDDFLMAQHVGMDGVGRRAEGRRANGAHFPMDLAVSTMQQDGHTQYIGVLRDLSTEQAAELAVIEAHRQLNEVDEMRRVIVHNAPYAIFVLNRQGVIQTVNPAGETLLGFKSSELIGTSTTQRFFDPEQVIERAHLLALRTNEPEQELDVLLHLAKHSPGLPTEWTLIRADGRSLVAEVSVTVLSDEVGQLTGYLAMAQDVTSRFDAENRVQHMAMHDSLTALPNRNMLQEHLKASMLMADREGHTLALMFIDLDRFKKINDTLGHHIGDSVLITVARRLRSSMRTSDVVARIGGDEFVVLLPRIAEAGDGQRVAQKILEEFAEPLRVGPHELRVTPSIGLVLYPQHGLDAITLMRHADLAMYQAKSLGRNRVQVYSDQLESPTAETLVLENDLYKALDRQEFRLHFQPQFDCATGRITGAEALVRWEHGGKLVPPNDFIPLAEETGLIVAIGEWVLRRACAQAQRWREMSGWPLRVAVNLSAVQLDRLDIAETVASALRDTGLPPTALELEITESVVVRESLRAADLLSELRALGITVAIDDFGVGYSSFAYLRELPVDRFKLDRSFLTAVPQSAGDSRLTAALIAMAHRLEVGIVAEGVETAEQHDFLRDHGCDEVQGYHLGRPMTEAAFEVLIMAHSQQHLAEIQALGKALA